MEMRARHAAATTVIYNSGASIKRDVNFGALMKALEHICARRYVDSEDANEVKCLRE